VRHYFSDFTIPIGNTISFQGYIFNPKFAIPAKATLKLQVNIPPLRCDLTVFPVTGAEFETEFTMTVHSCIDQNQPLQYRFYYYKTEQDFDEDKMVGKTLNAIAITDFSF
jgi:hypothetical protein